MSKEENLERDNKGDMKSLIDNIDWEQIRQLEGTYVFHYYDEKNNRYSPYFNLYFPLIEDIEKAKEDNEFFEKQLYSPPNHPPYDFYIDYSNSQLAMLIEFFKETFELSNWTHKYFKVILSKSKHGEIMNCLNDNKLLLIRDLIFEVIAIAQKDYISQIVPWENIEKQKLISSTPKEIEKIIRLIEKLDEKAKPKGKVGVQPASELSHINFIFNNETIKIEHKWLSREFIEHFKNHYNNLLFKDWKTNLELYPELFEDNIKKNQFKYKLANSFYNLLTKGGFFKISDKTPNNLMLCIAKLLEFCLIPLKDSDDPDEKRNIRNWLTRNKLEPTLIDRKVIADKERLLKYFEPEFINIPIDLKTEHAMYIGWFLGKRFNLGHLVNDFIHIAQALEETNHKRGFQIFGNGNMIPSKFEEFTAFKKLLNGVKEKSKITSIKYKIEGDDKEYELTQRLPMYLIEEAIKEYSENHQVEFDTDPVKTILTKSSDGGIKGEKENHFAQPKERFMVRFVKSFYDYLLPSDTDFMPSNRYYTIIAIMLNMTGFFYKQIEDESFIIAKVKQWHYLSITE